jgi:hypothetical protein
MYIDVLHPSKEAQNDVEYWTTNLPYVFLFSHHKGAMVEKV